MDGLFHPFVQADGSITRKYGGTGLGLSICKNLVELMGGQIRVDSRPGEGAVFRFTIVCEPCADWERETSRKRYRGRGEDFDHADIIDQIGGTRLLLVEDTPVNQQVAQELLERVGICVDLANNGVEAVQRVAEGHYDAVLMDVQMPVMDGYEAVETIRRDPRFAELPIIAMTAHAMASDREKCLAVGMNDHLGKPIDPQQLFSVLMAHIKPGDRLPIDRERLRHQPCPDPGETMGPEKMPGIDMESALRRVMGNRAVLVKLLMVFKRDYATMAVDVQAAIAQGESERARRMVHQVKGVAGTVGADAVFDAAHTLELAIEQGRTNDWPALIALLAAALQVVLASIAELQPVAEVAEMRSGTGDPVDAAAVPDRETLQPGLVALAGYLALAEMDSVAAFNTMKPLLLRVGFHRQVEQMQGEIDRFKFKSARNTLETIAQQLDIPL